MSFVANASIYTVFLLSIVTFVLYIIGNLKKDHRIIKIARACVIAVFALLSFAILLLLYFLITEQFQYEYVTSYTDQSLPMIYKITALWAGKQGSLLLWTFMISLFTVIITFSSKLHGKPIVNRVIPIMFANIVFFTFLLAFLNQPFAVLDQVPSDGYGLNPLLQNFYMVSHPLALLLGYAGMVVPFAFAMGALLMKDTSSDWIKQSRRWLIATWIFLTIGNVLGGLWAYLEQGWGGYWAWDPVENASLMPWFIATALIHSIMVQQRKNIFHYWNYSLVSLTYLLTIFGTYLTRSGIIESVHAFEKNSIGAYFLVYMALIIIFCVYLLFSRRQLIRESQSQIQMDSFATKQVGFLFANTFFLIVTIVVFIGTMFPIISDVFGEKKTVTADYYNAATAPVLLLLMILLATTPLFTWSKAGKEKLLSKAIPPLVISFAVMVIILIMGIHKPYALVGVGVVLFMIVSHVLDIVYDARARAKAKREGVFLALGRIFMRNRRKYGGYIAHIGIAFMMLGIVGTQNYSHEITKTLAPGQSVDLQDYTLTYNGLGSTQDGKKDIIFAKMSVMKDGKKLDDIQPEVVFYNDAMDNHTTEATIVSSFSEDLYVVMQAWDETGSATFFIKVEPMIVWLWIGAIIVTIGSLFALSTRKGNARRADMIEAKIEAESKTTSVDVLADIEAEIEAQLKKAQKEKE